MNRTPVRDIVEGFEAKIESINSRKAPSEQPYTKAQFVREHIDPLGRKGKSQYNSFMTTLSNLKRWERALVDFINNEELK